MTDSQRTLIAVRLDRSGSMDAIKTDTEGGFNAFIDQQRVDSLALGKDTRVNPGAVRY